MSEPIQTDIMESSSKDAVQITHPEEPAESADLVLVSPEPAPPPSAQAPPPAAPDPPHEATTEPPADTPAPGVADDVEKFEDQISEIRELLRTEQRARAEAEQAKSDQAEKARRDLLESLGLIKWDYQTLAPTAADADPFTEEGRRVYAKFRRENETLFKGSPEPPPADPRTVPMGGPRTWRDLFSGAAKGITK